MKYANGIITVSITVENLPVESADIFDIVDVTILKYEGIIESASFNGTVYDEQI